MNFIHRFFALCSFVLAATSLSAAQFEAQDLSLAGLKLVRVKTFADNRGFFRETYRKPLYEEMGIKEEFVQDNHSFSTQGTIRGMHLQRSPGMAKLVSVLSGRIFDVVVDIRPESPTFGKWEGVYLDADEGNQLFIPVGFAHGFCVVSDAAHVCYKVSSAFNPSEEFGFRYNDPAVGIEWPLSGEPILSDRDRFSPLMEDMMKSMSSH